MKKLYIPVTVTLTAAMLGACSSDDPANVANNGATVFTLNLPADMVSRADDNTLGDGVRGQIDKIQYTIFQVEGTGESATYTAVDNGEITDAFAGGTSLTTDVPMNFAKGRKYVVAFLASSSKSTAYSFNDGKMSITYANMGVNDVNDDAFTVLSDVVTDTDGQSQDLSLKRPFGQLNWGTNDLDASVVEKTLNGDALTATVTVSGGFCDTYDVLTATASKTGTEESLTFNTVTVIEAGATAPATTASFPVEGYDLVAMNFLLADATDIQASIEFNKDFGTTTVNNVPLLANQRTNIYGALLTNSGDFTVTIDPEFGGDDDKPATTKPWNGTTVTAPAIDETTKTGTIQSPEELAGLAALVNGTLTRAGGNSYAGYTFNITGNIDMGGFEIPTLGSAQRSGNAATGLSFEGTLNGNNYTISNFTLTQNGTNADDAVAFIPSLSGSTACLKNLSFENVTVNAANAKQVAVAVALVSNGATVENVKVLSGSVTGTSTVGGVVCRVMVSGNVTNCSNAATVTGKSNCGGVIGAAYYNSLTETMTVSGCTNTGKVSGTNSVGGVVGLCAGNVSGCNNSGEVIGSSYGVGGVVGEQQNSGSIKNCGNTGLITSTTTATGTYGTGGIVGWIRYNGQASDYPKKEVVVVDNCNNSAVINGGKCSGAGGIVGTVFNYVTVNGCTNQAPSITAGQWASGIVGGEQINTGNEIAGVDAKITVTNNTTTTSLDNLNATLKAAIMYVNNTNSPSVVMSGNTPNTQDTQN